MVGTRSTSRAKDSENMEMPETPAINDMQELLKVLGDQNSKIAGIIGAINQVENRLRNLESKSLNDQQNPVNPTNTSGSNIDNPINTNGRHRETSTNNMPTPDLDISSLSTGLEGLSIRDKSRPTNINIEKFNGKVNFKNWMQKFQAYCKINYIEENMKLEILVLLLEGEPASDSMNPSLQDFKKLSEYLSVKYQGRYSLMSAYHEYEIITSKTLRKPDDLEQASRKISEIVDILEEGKPSSLILLRKIEALSKILPLELRSKILLMASTFSSYDVAISATKRAWSLDYRADIERHKGNTLSKNNTRKDLYCSHCKTKTHNTNFCRFKDKNNSRREKINKVEEKQPSNTDNEFVFKISEDIKKGLIEIEKKGLIGTSVLINEHPCIAMVDPGSTCTILDMNLAKRLKIPIDTSNSTEVNVLSNSTIVYKLKDPITLNVLGYNIRTSNRIYISNIGFKNDNYQIILGNNILSKVNGVINTQERSFKLIDIDNESILNEENNLALNEINFILDKKSNEQLEKKLRLCLENDFKDVIARHEFDVGKGLIKTPLQEYYMEKEPLKIRYYPVPLDDQKELKRITDKYLENDIIERCESTHIAPVMILKKPSDPSKRRFVLDVRETNSITKCVNYEPPTLQSILNSIRKYQYASSIDFCSGFLQLMIPEQIRDYYAYRTSNGIFRFKRLVQGARNSPGIFQRTMENIFSPVKENILIYQDDILLISEGDEEKHKKLLYEFLSIARKHGLKINFNKCNFFKKIISFLGWDINPVGVTPSKNSVENIMRLQLPIDKKQLYQRLQKFSYHRIAIKNFALLSGQLYELASGRNCKIKLEGENLSNYLKIVQILYQQPLLYHANPNKPYILTCDASNTAIGATLSQLDDNGHEKPISFYSCKLPHVKKPRSATYNELYAIKRALQYNKYLLTGAAIKIRSDHRPLDRLIKSTQEKRFYDLVETINSYNCSIEYIQGSKNHSADCLSRLPHDEEEESSMQEEVNKAEEEKKKRGRPRKNFNKPDSEPANKKRGRPKKCVNQEMEKEIQINNDVSNETLFYNILSKSLELKEKQQRDLTIIESLETNMYDGKPIKIIDGIVNVLVPSQQGGENNWIPIIPEDSELVETIFNLCHSYLGHYGLEKSLKILRKEAYLKGDRKIFDERFKACAACALVNNPMSRNCKMIPIEYKQPFENLAIDVVGPFQPPSIMNHKYIILYVDSMTRFTIAYPIINYDYENIVETLKDLIFTYGSPLSVKTDNAANFKSQMWKQALETTNIKLLHSTEYHSRGNSIAERSIRNLQLGLKKLVNKNVQHWHQYVKPLCYFYNVNICNSTGKSPYFLNFLREPNLDIQKLLNVKKEYLIDINRPLAELKEFAKEAYDAANIIIRDSADKRIASIPNKYILDENQFKVNDLVYAKIPDYSRGKKLAKNWAGPFQIVEINNRTVYLKDTTGNNKKLKKLHMDRLKKFHSQQGGVRNDDKFKI